MSFFVELFRFDELRRTPLLVTVPLAAFIVTGILTTVVLIVVQWPSDSWRLLLALITGIAAASLARWVLLRRQRSRPVHAGSDDF